MAYQALPVLNESVSAVTATNSVDLGTVRVFSGEEYVYLYNDGGASITVGYGVISSANTGYSVTVSSLTQVGAFFAVCKHATVPTANYFWGLTKGYTKVKNGMASTALAAGDQLTPAVDGAFTLATGALTSVIIGQVQQATGSAGTGYAFVRCFGS